MVKGISGRTPLQEMAAALPSFPLTDGTGPTDPTWAATSTGNDGMTLTYFPKKLYGSDYEPCIHAGDELFIVTGGLPSAATASGRQVCRKR